jgi:hypothetical protein
VECATGELEHRGIVRVDPDRGQVGGRRLGLPFEQLPQRPEPIGGRTVHDGQPEARCGAPHPGDDLTEVGVLRPVRHHAGDRLGQPGELLHLPVPVLGECHDRDGAELLQRDVEVGERGVVRQLDHDPVQRP